MRKIIQIAVSAVTSGNVVHETTLALCDDGTTWVLLNLKKGWRKIPDIPQPLTEHDKQEIDRLLVKDRQEGLCKEESMVLKSLIADYKLRG